MKKKRFIPLISPLIILILNEVVFIEPKLFFIVLSLGALVLFLSVRVLGKDNKEKYWPLFGVLPILIFLSLSSYSALIASKILIQVIFLFSFLLNFYYLRTIYYYLVNREYNRGLQIGSFSVLAGFFIVFSFYSAAFILPLFINLAPALLTLIPLPIIWFLFFKGVYFNLNSFKEGSLIFLITTLIVAQLSWVLSYFPLSPHILGFVIALIYYLLLMISLLYFKGSLKLKTIKWPLT
ncbi:hypothetical protein JXK06_03070, partial [Patescibacteria group bacterium]|nr:hypothetical protein [Patescibacteria group bacterium]